MPFSVEMELSLLSDFRIFNDFPSREQEAVSRQYPNCWKG